VLLAGLSLYTVAGFVAAAPPNATTLIVTRVIQSLGGCSGLMPRRRSCAMPPRRTGPPASLRS
jgi:MFS transporter, DHA1 family, multidrug resistance protein